MENKRVNNVPFLKDRRGQGLSVNAIILILLGVVVLVILILGFTMGWSRVLPFINTNNIQNVANSCEAACITESQYDFCSAAREVKDGTNDAFTSNCTTLSTNPAYAQYGIDECAGLCNNP